MSIEKYIIPNNTLDEKSKLLADKVISYILDPEQRETGLSFILNRLYNPKFSEILIQINPRLYTQFLESDDSSSLTTALYIVNALSKKAEYIILFLKYDKRILDSLKGLLNCENELIFKNCLIILDSFIETTKRADLAHQFIPILINDASVFPNNRQSIIAFMTKVLVSPESVSIYLDNDGLSMVKQSLENSQNEELLGAVEIILRIIKYKQDGKTLLFKEGFLKTLTDVIGRTDNQNTLERAINVASQLSSCEFFASSCIDCGLFEECLDLLEYPYVGKSTASTLMPSLLIIFRITQDRVGAKKCSSLKLATKLSKLLLSVKEFQEVMQAMLFGIITNLFSNDQARKEMILTKVDKVVLQINPIELQPKGKALWVVCVKTFNEMKKQTQEIEYTPIDIQRMAEYNSKKTKARQITEEFIQTETSYTNQMGICCRVVMKRLGNVLKENTSIVFGNIIDIEKYHHKFSNELEKCLSLCNEEKLEFITFSDILLKYFTPSMLDLYCQYANNVDIGMAKFNELSRTDVDVGCAVKELSSKGHYVPSFLIQPIQRIPRYVLLLESLLKCLPEYLDETKKIKTCLSKIRSIANEINENKRKFENKTAMDLWNKRIDLSDYPNPQRDYFAEMGQVLVSEKKNATVWTMVIFNDIAVLTRNTAKSTEKEKWKIKEVYTLCDWKVLEIINEKIQFFKPSTNTTIEITCNKLKDTEFLSEQLRKAINTAKQNKIKRTSITNS
ncbi:guanine nucleotide exchange factor, putative [Entamoeba histolytica HM-1:IMSS-B]|uniref:Guanine nucleotide exchange factor, putative n=4 Tax=Entamoeba histolytica TaxID=5759 RepID=C4LV55_ENTH1|nr:guanine nucleotide exchange factor, putative [Entamoeba histolytica HM-1:IMSS]EAL50089.1 guanine nucleotide exchange factor, putative [Entamoeba histolytica HM-1:IMSS]EMH72305.1 guanine nucleotide exchange factor, putative [Entamoeba histolytica HM-1:IMSS-B]ENY63618.1 guanine nucleotide exchange factor, putative [Entamoeba histolytica HM-1:IMSS-A]GAT92536.1 guanine nucleotide exchange factor putative [Entamoeba histolytica]|eukprot:XP_655475.1 guanine nucleotide exchange factor, putative [Entamoeba histolytica HM-1:IMSS]